MPDATRPRMRGPARDEPPCQCGPDDRGNGKTTGGRDSKIEPVPQGTWLFVRYDDADGGARPVPSGDTFWESPDIWFDGGDALGNAIAGKPTPVHCRIWNIGTLRAFPTFVYFAFAAPWIGIDWSKPQLISREPSVANVPPWILGPGLAEVDCLKPWIPPAGTTHACLLVMCTCGVSNDKPTQPWSAATDRHVAQHNVNIAAASVGESLTFELHLTNVTPAAAIVQIATQAAWVEAKTPRDALRYSSTAMRNAMAGLDRSPGTQQMRLLASRTSRLFRQLEQVKGVDVKPEALRDIVRLRDITGAGRARNGAIVIPTLNAVRGLNGYTPVDKPTELKPLQHRKAALEVKVPRPPGAARTLLVRIAQFENEYATGGYTIVVAVKD